MNAITQAKATAQTDLGWWSRLLPVCDAGVVVECTASI